MTKLDETKVIITVNLGVLQTIRNWDRSLFYSVHKTLLKDVDIVVGTSSEEPFFNLFQIVRI
jgi:hypothetical protein